MRLFYIHQDNLLSEEKIATTDLFDLINVFHTNFRLILFQNKVKRSCGQIWLILGELR